MAESCRHYLQHRGVDEIDAVGHGAHDDNGLPRERPGHHIVSCQNHAKEDEGPTKDKMCDRVSSNRQGQRHEQQNAPTNLADQLWHPTRGVELGRRASPAQRPQRPRKTFGSTRVAREPCGAISPPEVTPANASRYRMFISTTAGDSGEHAQRRAAQISKGSVDQVPLETEGPVGAVEAVEGAGKELLHEPDMGSGLSGQAPTAQRRQALPA